jgi:glycine hydroxymethyltransferase
VVDGLSKIGPEGDAQIEKSVRQRVSTLCAAFPVYPGM